MGSLVKWATPEAFKLAKSYGHTSPDMVSMMRFWVILAEFTVFVPGLLFLVSALFGYFGNKSALTIFFAVLMSVPALYADHGHF